MSQYVQVLIMNFFKTSGEWNWHLKIRLDLKPEMFYSFMVIWIGNEKYLFSSLERVSHEDMCIYKCS